MPLDSSTIAVGQPMRNYNSLQGIVGDPFPPNIWLPNLSPSIAIGIPIKETELNIKQRFQANAERNCGTLDCHKGA